MEAEPSCVQPFGPCFATETGFVSDLYDEYYREDFGSAIEDFLGLLSVKTSPVVVCGAFESLWNRWCKDSSEHADLEQVWQHIPHTDAERLEQVLGILLKSLCVRGKGTAAQVTNVAICVVAEVLRRMVYLPAEQFRNEQLITDIATALHTTLLGAFSDGDWSLVECTLWAMIGVVGAYRWQSEQDDALLRVIRQYVLFAVRSIAEPSILGVRLLHAGARLSTTFLRLIAAWAAIEHTPRSGQCLSRCDWLEKASVAVCVIWSVSAPFHSLASLQVVFGRCVRYVYYGRPRTFGAANLFLAETLITLLHKTFVGAADVGSQFRTTIKQECTLLWLLLALNSVLYRVSAATSFELQRQYNVIELLCRCCAPPVVIGGSDRAGDDSPSPRDVAVRLCAATSALFAFGHSSEEVLEAKRNAGVGMVAAVLGWWFWQHVPGSSETLWYYVQMLQKECCIRIEDVSPTMAWRARYRMFFGRVGLRLPPTLLDETDDDPLCVYDHHGVISTLLWFALWRDGGPEAGGILATALPGFVSHVDFVVTSALHSCWPWLHRSLDSFLTVWFECIVRGLPAAATSSEPSPVARARLLKNAGLRLPDTLDAIQRSKSAPDLMHRPGIDSSLAPSPAPHNADLRPYLKWAIPSRRQRRRAKEGTKARELQHDRYRLASLHEDR